MEQLTEFATIRIPRYVARDLAVFLDECGIADMFKNEADELRYMVMMDRIISKGIDAVKEDH